MPAPRVKPSLVEHLAAQAAAKPVNALLSLDKYFTSADLLLQQVLLEQHLPELERVKLSLKTKDIQEPVAHSTNRPVDAVQLSVSSLPQLDWTTVQTPRPGYAQTQSPQDLKVDDLLDIISSRNGTSSNASPTTPSAPPAPHSWNAMPTSSTFAAAAAPLYQSKYISATSATSGKHALFVSRPSSAHYAASTGSMPAYPGSSQGSSARPLLPYPAMEELQQQQQRHRQEQQQQLQATEAMQQLSIMDPFNIAQQEQLRSSMLQPPPSAGPSLGPQEVEVLPMSHHHDIPATCSPTYAPPPSADPTQSSTALVTTPQGGMREVVKKAQLRDVHVSLALMEEFLHIANANTARGIESCGILAGRLSANDSIFSISTLIIPKQQGTTDTVQALNEEEIFEAQFKEELYPLGWIHTHPTQTCFLSSIDIHTQCGYQTMLDEAIAIVMAPTDRTKKCGIFRLSTPGGLGLIQKCNLRGFHTHPDTSTGQDIYELCGHVYLNPRTKHNIIDLRT